LVSLSKKGNKLQTELSTVVDNFENPKKIFGLRKGSNIATNGAISVRGLRCELENVQEERRPPGSRFGESITCRSDFYMQRANQE